MEVKFFICEICGNIVEKARDSGIDVICCGQPMTRIVANTEENVALEKHISVVSAEGDKLKIQVGSILHPMIDKHFIEWILIVTPKSVKRYPLKSGDEPIIYIPKEDNIEVYAYCNVHGLWKLENK